jgi:UDP-4-amino-4,6-dideoxy-N-acetyl-beta-L-altrosamine transaminase
VLCPAVATRGMAFLAMTALDSYGRHVVDDDDVAAVEQVLRGAFLTSGPVVEAFEAELASQVGARHAIVCNSGTAALYLAARAAELAPDRAVIVPSVTFLATASANVLAGIEVVFADVNPDTGLMEESHVHEAMARAGGRKVSAIYPVHLAGQVAEPAALKAYADANDLVVIEDACHALGTHYGNGAHQVGGCSHSLAACFSFHPVKTIAMGEGGAVTTQSDEVAARVRRLRNHGMTRTASEFANGDLAFAATGGANPWYYEAPDISHNFRASDINCALGLSQLRKLGRSLATRRSLMARYRKQIAALSPVVRLVLQTAGTEVGWHLCTVLIDFEGVGLERSVVMQRLKSRGIGTQVHYIPVHLQPFYRARYGDIHLPGAVAYYKRTLTLPLFIGMTEADVDTVVDALAETLKS